MKTQRQTKAEPDSKKIRATKRPKSSSGTNGNTPLVSYEHAPIGIVECSPDGIYLRANEEFARLLGYEKEELVGKGIKAITHEDDYPIDIKLHQQLVEGKIPFYRLEKRYLRKEGGSLWVELTRTIVRDDAGSPLYTIGVVLDISDRKHVEKVLRDSSERLRLATEAARMFMWELDIEKRVYTFADNFEQVIGFSAGLLPKNNAEIVERLSPPEDVKAFWDAFEEAVASHSDLHSLQIRLINPENGQITWLEVNAKIVYRENGTAERMFGVAQNITQNKRAEELERSAATNLLAIAEANAKFRTFFDQGSYFAGVMALDGTLIEANRICLDFCGFTREEVIGKKFWDCGWWNPSPDLMEMIQNGTREAVEGKIFRKESTYFMADGSIRYVDLIIAPVKDEKGQVLFLAPTGTDITERKQMEEALRESERKFKLVYDNVPFVATLSMAEDPALVDVNEHFERVFGITRDEALGKTSLELGIHPDAQARQRMLEELQREGAVHNMEIELLTRWHGKRTFLGNIDIVTLAGEKYILNTLQDITERKQAEEKLHQQAEILELAPVAIRDLDSRIISWSKGMEQLYGWTKEDALGKESHDLFQTKFPVSFEDYQQKLFANAEWEGELEHVKRDGSQLIVLSHQVLHRDAAGNPVAILEDNTDITERKRIARQQEALYQLTDQLHRTNSPEDVFNAALDAIRSALHCDRASILLFDESDVMHFVAWHGLSEDYRKATDGHSPWTVDAKDPEPICMNDVTTADLSDSLRTTIKEEGIGALAFIPLISNGKLIGKFMTYYNIPHVFNEAEVQLSMTIARQLASGIERKRAEDALARERELLNRLFETMPVMVSIYDPKTNSLRLNAEFEQRLGWKTEDVSVFSLLESLYPDPDYRSQVIRRMSAAGRNDWVEVKVQTRDGRTLDSIWSNISILNDRQIGIGVDITERKRAEEALRASEEKYRRMVETASEGIWEIDKDTRTVFVNARMAEMLGYTVEEMIGRSSFEFIFSEDHSEGEKRLAHARQGVAARADEFRYRRKDGSILWAISSNTPKHDEQGNFLGAFAMISDITDRKRAEEKLHQTASFDEAVMGSMGEGLYTVDSEGNVTSMNPAAEKMFGWTLDELLGRRMHDVTHYKHPDGTPFPAEDCAGFQVLHHGHKLVGQEDAFIRKDGTFFDVIYSSSPLWDNGKINGLVVVFSDNTIRKQAEKRLVLLSEISELIRKSDDTNELLFAVSEAVGDYFQARRCLFNEIDLENDVEIVHRDYCRGVESVAGVHMVSDYSTLTSAEMEAGKTVVNHDSKTDPRTAPDYERSYVANGERAYVTVPLMRQNRWVASLWLSDDRPRQWSQEDVSLLETVAERTWIEVEKLRINEALRSSEALYRTIARSIPGGGVYVVDKDMRYIVADGAVTAAFGLSSQQLEGHTVSEVFRGEQRERMIERLSQNFAGQTVSYETEHNGRVYWTQQAPLIESIGQAIIVTLDITERKQMEEALRQSEERFVQFMEHLPGLAWIKDVQGRYMYTNAAAEKAFNASRLELYGKTDQEIFPSEVAAQFTKNDERALSEGTGGVQVVETLEQADGLLHYSLVNKFPIPGLNGEITLIGGTAFDITERKQAEEALRESEERYRTLFESIDEGFCVIEKVEDQVGQPLDFLYVEANPAFANQAGVGGVVGKTIRQAFPGEPEEWFEIYDNILKTGAPRKFERELVTQGRILEIYAFRVEDGTNRRVAVVFNDITERKRAEDALQSLNLQLETRVVVRTAELQEANAALQESRSRLQFLSQRLVEVQEEERRAIARELHDRVGQTLSALNINMIIMRDQLLPDSLERVEPRLNDSMHLVGETITLVRDVMSNLRPSVLDDYGLEAALQSHIDEYKSRYEIKVVLERPPQLIPRLGPSIEMTFLRIAQEALMNIARHANASQVTLSIRQEADSICMTIQDNGNGIVSWQQANRPGSHGLTIMRERAEAVGGSLTVASVPGKGTRVEMSIPIGKASQNEVEKEMLE